MEAGAANSEEESKHDTLLDSLKLSLTFWLIVGAMVWLAICQANQLYPPGGDVLKIFLACEVGYALLGLFFWLPVWCFARLLRALRVMKSPGNRLQFGAHLVMGILLTLLYPLHKFWFPNTPARSWQGLAVTLALVLLSAVCSFLLLKLFSRLSSWALFRSRLRIWITCLILLLAVYGAQAGYYGISAGLRPPLSAEQKTAYNTGAKVLLIGFDAATWKVIDPLLQAGKLPNFARVIEGGIRVPLRSSKPTLSSILWTTIATGKSSSGHGVTEIISTVAPGLKQNVLTYPQMAGCDLFAKLLTRANFLYIMPISSTARRTKAIWNILTDYQERVGVVGWWGTYPPEVVNGVIISDHASLMKNQMREAKGQLTPEANINLSLPTAPVYPPELMPELVPFADSTRGMSLEELNYFIGADSALLNRVNKISNWDRTQLESVFKICYLVDKYFRLSTEHLLATQDFDLLMSFFFEGDGVSHWMWDYREPEKFPGISSAEVAKYGGEVDSVYINLDRILGSLLAQAQDKYHIMIISDHGFEVEYHGDIPATGHTNAPDGILIMNGPYFNPGAEPQEPARLLDITPTILTLLGIPVGEDMEGRPLLELINSDFLQQFPPRTIASHDQGKKFKPHASEGEGDQALKEKLRALGYIK